MSYLRDVGVRTECAVQGAAGSGSFTPMLSVIIVTFRSRAEIEACLQSIPRSLQERPVQVIVVENASGDGIGEVVRGRFPGVTYLELANNVGFAKANNIGYEKADGDFILFLNPDSRDERL